MSDAIAFLLILPSLVLGVVVLDAAGTLGVARYRTSVFTETAAVSAAEALASAPDPDSELSDWPRWGESVSAVEQFGRAATAGVCNQTDAAFAASLMPNGSDSSPSVAVVVICPVELGRLFVTERVVAARIEPVG